MRRPLARLLHAGAEWRHRQLNDPYVKEAARLGYRSRAALKLIQLDEKLKFLRPHRRVLELGAAPGSWTQVLVQRNLSAVVAMDVLPIVAVPGSTFVLGDLKSETVQAELITALGGHPVDLVLSDISPNRAGHHSVDQARLIGLIVDAFVLARRVLKPGGSVLCKALRGEDHQSEIFLFAKEIDFVKFDAALEELREVG